MIFVNTQCKSLSNVKFTRVEALATSASQLLLHRLHKPCHNLKLHVNKWMVTCFIFHKCNKTVFIKIWCVHICVRIPTDVQQLRSNIRVVTLRSFLFIFSSEVNLERCHCSVDGYSRWQTHFRPMSRQSRCFSAVVSWERYSTPLHMRHSSHGERLPSRNDNPWPWFIPAIKKKNLKMWFFLWLTGTDTTIHFTGPSSLLLPWTGLRTAKQHKQRQKWYTATFHFYEKEVVKKITTSVFFVSLLVH